MSLAGVNVLVTRPEGQAAPLVAAIEHAGGRAWHYPVMAICALDSAAQRQYIEHCKQQILQLDQFRHVIFISVNAVNFGMEWIDRYWPQLPLGIHWHGIGGKTVAALAAAGAPVAADSADHSGAMNSEALLAQPSLRQLDQQKVLIVRGIGGRETLRQQLQRRGASVAYAECYQRRVVDKPIGEIAALIHRQAIDSVCVNSGESLQNLCYLVGSDHLPDVKTRLLVVPGERVAAEARQLGFAHIAVADNAGDRAVVAALQRARPK